MLNDSYSKNLFLKLLKFNMAISLLGYDAWNKYSLYPDHIWKKLEKKAENIEHVDNDYIRDRIETFILEGYRYKKICSAEKGDYVIDCGAYTGNTVRYFANKVGAYGKVFAFEAMPETFNILKDNINDKNVLLYNNAIYSKPCKIPFTKEANSASHMTNSHDSIIIDAVSIDNFVENNCIKKINFIKMDIEGNELDGIKGAEKTIKRFLPKLAICIYHKLDDFINIPKKIININGNYRFYIRHNSNNFWETVLFASPCQNQYNIKLSDQYVRQAKEIWNIFDIFYYKGLYTKNKK